MICTIVMTYYLSFDHRAYKYREHKFSKQASVRLISEMIASKRVKIKDLSIVEYKPFDCQKAPKNEPLAVYDLKERYMNIEGVEK